MIDGRPTPPPASFAGPRVVLVGPPGLGKTALGGLLAAALGVELVTAGDRRPHRGSHTERFGGSDACFSGILHSTVFATN